MPRLVLALLLVLAAPAQAQGWRADDRSSLRSGSVAFRDAAGRAVARRDLTARGDAVFRDRAGRTIGTENRHAAGGAVYRDRAGRTVGRR
ncbi:MAG: hypothetical protein K2X11_05830 [Acetobacteraceae bacterium]|nr:hypothetical protein [Acetobacteraceae bacterium]